MSVGHITPRPGRSLTDRPTSRLSRLEVGYSTNDCRAGISSKHGLVIGVGGLGAGARMDCDAVR